MLSTIAMGMALFSWFFITDARLSVLDQLLPVTGLAAVLFMRTLTTLSEARRIAKAGFTADDIMAGFQRVAAERASRRDELRSDGETRIRRSRTLRFAIFMLATAIVMMVVAFRMRRPLGHGQYASQPAGIALAFGGMGMIGMSMVLLLRSPFRMPVGERVFRVLWLGPIGRAFVRFGARSAKRGIASAAAKPKVRAASVPVPALALTRGPGSIASAPQPDRLAELERRVSALEESSRIHQLR
jgi:hypothetical protein